MVTVKLPDPSFVWTVASGRRFRLQSSQADFREMLHAWLRPAIWLTLVTVLEEEVTAFIGAPRCGRTASQRDERNGDYKRDLMTTAGNAEQLPVPRTRGAFRTQVFERYQRRQAKLETAISEKFVFGASTTRVGEVVERLTNVHPNASTVSRVFHTLEVEFTAWETRRRPPITFMSMRMARISRSMTTNAISCPCWL